MTSAASLAGRVAAVTGGSRGIGRAIAEALADRGASVALSYREREREAREVEATLRDRGVAALALRCDVADPVSVTDFFTQVSGKLGPVDILINNAGINRDSMLLFMDAAKWDDVMRVNLDGAYHCSRAVVRGMLLRRWGRIINITSPSAYAGVRGQANYAASKAGLIGLTKALSRELAGNGVLVNAISPGLIDTEMLAAMPADKLAGYLESVPVGRIGRPQEVAALAAFLASDEGSYISGQVIAVDGGLV